MAKAMRRPEFWATVVAEARSSKEPHDQIAARHGVTAAALKYHLYKARGARRPGKQVGILPVRVGSGEQQLEVELGPNLRLRFGEGCDPGYLAALIAKLR